MAVPENLNNIKTNIPRRELRDFLRAIKTKEAKQVPGTSSVFAGSSGCQFDYKGARYEIAESFELLIMVWLIRREQRELPLGLSKPK